MLATTFNTENIMALPNQVFDNVLGSAMLNNALFVLGRYQTIASGHKYSNDSSSIGEFGTVFIPKNLYGSFYLSMRASRHYDHILDTKSYTDGYGSWHISLNGTHILQSSFGTVLGSGNSGNGYDDGNYFISTNIPSGDDINSKIDIDNNHIFVIRFGKSAIDASFNIIGYW